MPFNVHPLQRAKQANLIIKQRTCNIPVIMTIFIAKAKKKSVIINT